MSKNLIAALLLMLSVELKSNHKATAYSSVSQEIHYLNREAGEVFIVWGINGWNTPELNAHPPESYVKGGLVYSPMISDGKAFKTTINVAEGTMIDYVFWITKGPRNTATDVWDNNADSHRDFHTTAADNDIAIVTSSVKARPREQLSLLDFSWNIFITSSVLLLGFAASKRLFFRKIKIKQLPSVIILASAICTTLLLFFVRPSVSGVSWDFYLNPLSFAPQMYWMAIYDLYYISFLAFVFMALVWAFRNYPRVRMGLALSFSLLCLLSVIVAICNIRVVELLGKPFNYQWLYYSDFLNSAESKEALSANLPPSYVSNFLVLCFAFIIGSILLTASLHLLAQNAKVRRVMMISFFGLSGTYLIMAEKSIQSQNYDYDKLANPIFAFIESINPFSEKPALFTMEVADSLKDFRSSRKSTVHNMPQKREKIKNVLIYVLESTPAEYMEVYGGKYEVTPELEKLKHHSVIFENIYAHAPATNLSMVSILSSIYPTLSYNSITQEHPDINVATISSELKKHNYRTAFFNSADNRFQNAGGFLANRNLDLVRDCRDNICEKFVTSTDWDFMDGKDDACTAEELMEWIEKDKEKPFFAMMWTYQTHYPYFVNGEEQIFTEADPFFNRYLNAVRHNDMVLGKIVRQLKERKLYESTLLVVVGDHGEAFGRHGQITHARKIYEENLHVPCVFINPAFEQQKLASVGGLIDVAPTVLNVLGYQAPEQWLGENLFAINQNKRVYFFAPWSDFLFGYREGNFKYIYNATKNVTEIYNLQRDPHETKNLAPDLPWEVELCHQRLAAWTQHVNQFMGHTLSGPGAAQLAKK
jgi:lipoteichoic acid synthase